MKQIYSNQTLKNHQGQQQQEENISVESAIIQNILTILNINEQELSFPIKALTLSKLYQKHIQSLPKEKQKSQCIIQYSKSKKLTVEQSLIELIKNSCIISQFLKSKVSNLQESSNQTPPIIQTSVDIFQKVLKDSQQYYQNFIRQSDQLAINYSKIEESIFKTYSPILKQLNKNNQFIKRFIKFIIFQNKDMIIELLSGTFLVLLSQLDSHHLLNRENLLEESSTFSCLQIQNENYEKKKFLSNKNKSHQVIACLKQSFNQSNLQKINKQKFDQTELNEQINLERVIVVNNESTLSLAEQSLAGCKSIGVDLEGNLRADGYIDLIQISSGDKIFIFDIFCVQAKAKKRQDLSNKKTILYIKMINLIKKIMEDSSICKIFHSSRYDSIALHSFMDCCVTNNIFDTSAIHILNEYLKHAYQSLNEVFSQSQNQSQNKLGILEQISKADNEEIKVQDHSSNNQSKSIESLVIRCNSIFQKIGPPGLNKILSSYGASHGSNPLKDYFHANFSNLPKEYFTQRPMPLEWIVYSAKDVEDLIEVQKNMLQHMSLNLKNLGYKNITLRQIEFLCREISKTYSSFGCCSLQQKGNQKTAYQL